MYRLLSILIVITTPFASSAADDDVGQELKSLQGTWKTVSLEAGGKPLPKEAVVDFMFIVGADGKSIGRMPQSEYESKVSVNPQANPKTIDNSHETGQHQGKMQYGIYRLEGDKWTVCMTAPGAAASDRPKSFETKDTASVVFTFERVKEDKSPDSTE